MCDACRSLPRHPHASANELPRLSRRALLLGAVGLAGASSVAAVLGPFALPAGAATVTLGAVQVTPRSSWGADLAPKGPLTEDADVRFLLVHHSVDPANDYTADQVPGLLRQIYDFHTRPTTDPSPGKGWADVAYSFFVDRFGGVWEGRTGSLNKAIVNDETGGNQGFARFCCFLGDHRTAPPSAAALDSMGKLLGSLASRHHVSMARGATATFVSKGSQLFPSGTTATVRTLSGHRDVGQTECPGDAAYALLADDLRGRAESTAALLDTPATTTTKNKGTSTTRRGSLPYLPGTIPPQTAIYAPVPATTTPGLGGSVGIPTTIEAETSTTLGTLGAGRRVTIRDSSGAGQSGLPPLVYASAGALGVLLIAAGVWDIRRRLTARAADRGWKRPGQEADETVGSLPAPASIPRADLAAGWADLRTDGAASTGQAASTAIGLPEWEKPDDEAVDRWLSDGWVDPNRRPREPPRS